MNDESEMSISNWEQSYILRVKSGFEIPLDVDEMPNPAIWKRTDGPKRGVNDYYSMAVCGRPITRSFSQSTSSWYDMPRPVYIPSIVDAAPRKDDKTIKAQAISKEPIRINEEEASNGGPKQFASIENFFQ
jgi:hypothetical protein